ncbi:MAG: hypothetical protein FWB90_03990 [Fibromonadales bacterium]|nr:hypothetical protein [Fibromonadales bacterium]
MSDLFIIGAGASKPYGFPTGYELLKKMKGLKTLMNKSEQLHQSEIDRLKKKSYPLKDPEAEIMEENLELRKEMSRIGTDDPRVAKIFNNALDELSKSQAPSVDDFLRNRTDIYEINMTKMILSKIILFYERRYRKREVESDIDWIQYLCTYTDRKNNLNDFLKSKFIIFNYDRIFEYCILNYLTSENKCHRSNGLHMVVNCMDITHVHGDLGKLDKFEFGSEFNDIEFTRLRTVWDKKDEFKNVYSEINKYFLESNRVFFLGFGYLKENLDVLEINQGSNILSGKEIYGTIKNLAKTKIESLMKSCGAKSVKMVECTANELVKEYFDV